MTRVVVISQLPPPVHGSTIMTRTFLQTLAELGDEWRLVDRRFSSSVADVGKFSIRKVASAAWMPLRLLWTLLTFKPETVVFFATNRAFSFLVDWVLSEILRWFRVRRINYLHAVGFEALAAHSRAFGWMIGRMLGSAHITVHLGPALAKDISRWVDESRIVFIPNTVADLPEDLGRRDPSAPPLVLYLSNLIPEKGAGTFIDLAIKLAPEFPDATFTLAGATSEEAFTDSLIDKVIAADLSLRVRFAGAITNQHDKWHLVRDALVLVFPSTYSYETFGLVLAEALACGTPTATYRSGALAPMIEAASAGVVVDIGDERNLERGVRALLSDEVLAARMGDRARALYEREYTRDRFRERWAAVITGSSGTA